MKYEAKVTAIGESVLSFMKIRNSIIIFDNDVPYAYENMVVSHTKSTLTQPIEVGDKLLIADEEYQVSDVGSEANQTLKEHGHCTLVFGVGIKAEMPGQIALEGKKVPRIMIGDMIRFVQYEGRLLSAQRHRPADLGRLHR